ncbi:MAG: D-alanine--D-alanine ligase [Clostridia bacterium]|nr:D-alanine--D-alanine ligase [Clostridia bacterium]
MKKTKPTVLLIYGGVGVEHDVSVMSADNVYSLIDQDEFAVIPIFISNEGDWYRVDKIYNPCDAEKKSLPTVHLGVHNGRGGIFEDDGFTAVDVAFPMLHGDGGEDGIVQGALECAKIKFVGPDFYSGPVTMDKAFTKIIAESLGIPTARFVLSIAHSPIYSMERSLERAEKLFGYPMFIKPSRLGSSIGASRADTKEEARAAYKMAQSFSDRILIEELVDIEKEAECAYFKVKNKEIITDLAEISCSFGFYDYEKKYYGGVGAALSEKAKISPKTSERIREYTRMLSQYVGTRHLSRFDFFIARDGRVLFNEINAIPGFTKSSLYPTLLSEYGLSPSHAVALMIRDALEDA